MATYVVLFQIRIKHKNWSFEQHWKTNAKNIWKVRAIKKILHITAGPIVETSCTKWFGKGIVGTEKMV